MNTRDEAAYRLELAEGYLHEADDAYLGERWHACLAGAQESVENSVKAMVACLAPVVKTHDPAKQLAGLLGNQAIPSDLRDAVQARLVDFYGLGREAHIRATYGDERTHTPPWRLIPQSEAEDALKKARAALALARRFHAYYFPSETS